MIYKITRTNANVTCTVIDHNGEKELDPIGWHSSEFNYGYGGSGPAELALAILADWFDESINLNNIWSGHNQAWDLHQDFKWTFLADHVDVSEFLIDELQMSMFCFKAVKQLSPMEVE